MKSEIGHSQKKVRKKQYAIGMEDIIDSKREMRGLIPLHIYGKAVYIQMNYSP